MKNPNTIDSSPDKLFGVTPPPSVPGSTGPNEGVGSNGIPWSYILVGLFLLVVVCVICDKRAESMVLRKTDEMKAQLPRLIAEQQQSTAKLPDEPELAKKIMSSPHVTQEAANTVTPGRSNHLL